MDQQTLTAEQNHFYNVKGAIDRWSRERFHYDRRLRFQQLPFRQRCHLQAKGYRP